jgi:ABC-type branched-subunit amino acid transport system substrate-binding protein
VAVVLALAACSDAGPGRAAADMPTIAYLFDGSIPDADLVTAPALSGLELAAHRTGTVEVEPVDLGGDPAETARVLREIVDDPLVVAAVIAPWTAPPAGAIELLARGGLPVVTLSWAWGPPAAGAGPWLSLVADRAREAVLLLSAADVAPEGATVCLGGDDVPTGRALLGTAEELGRAAGDPEVVVVGTSPPETDGAAAGTVADRIADAGCPVLVWAGGAPGAASVLPRIRGLPSIVVGPSLLKTDDGLLLAAPTLDVLTVCACADVTLTLDPVLERFVHDLQAESGSPPGPFAVEAYDAGRFLGAALPDTAADDPRAAVAAAMTDPADVEGLAGRYTFQPDGSRTPATMTVGVWRAAGSRWLPVERSTVPSG